MSLGWKSLGLQGIYEPESLDHRRAAAEMFQRARKCSENSQCDDAQPGIWVLAFRSGVEIDAIVCFWEVLH